MSQLVEAVPLHRAAEERYLSYALSVITSRALPDVRDGLKPVQRRILYAMYNDMGLVPSARYRKCAGVVGEVMGKYHPHGDQAIYDALVRMAQDFSLRVPLVDGQGNFGSLDGDPPAAMRYTECRLLPLAEELLSEIRKSTVDFRPNYDGQRTEPVVLPAQLPHLLVNGCEGIAVGMATRIPPHNLTEVVDACIALIDRRDMTVGELLGIVQGPDFPTGGRILTTPAELAKIYETGQGSLKVRATWAEVTEGKNRQIILDSIPYGQNKAKLVEHIGEEVRTRRLPQVTDVRDESTDEVRVVLDLKPDATAEAVMAYLFKRTDLQTTWPVNLTALVPTSDSGVPGPARLDLKQILEHWLDFRLQTIRRRYEYDLAQLRARIHILEGFVKIFDALDEAIRIIRASEGRRDAAISLMARFDLTEIQTDAILDLRLYKLAQLEIESIREELADKRQKAEHIEQILASEKKLWGEIRKELRELRKHYDSPRRTLIGEGVSLEFDENAYIVAEDTYVVVTRDGWIKRQSSYQSLDRIRVRDGDEIGWLFLTNTRSTLTFFTDQGGAYVMRVDGVPQTSGYGEPVQASFSFADGEVVVGVMSNDERHRLPSRPLATPEDPPTPYAVVVTAGGRGMRFPLPPHTEISNRTGRRFARLVEGDQVLAVWGLPGENDRVRLVTSKGRTCVFDACEMPLLKSPGKGLTALKLEDDEKVVAFELATDEGAGPVVEAARGKRVTFGELASAENGAGPTAIREWIQSPLLLDKEPPAIDPEVIRSLVPYRIPPRTTPTPEEKQAAAEQRAAERAAAAERREAERQVAAERAAAKKAAAEQKRAEKQAVADQRAAERAAAAAQREAEKQAAAERAAAKKAAAEQKEAEKQQRAAERAAAAAQREAERLQKEAEKQAAIAQREAEKRAAEELRAAKQAAIEQKRAEKQAAADQRAAERAAAAAQREAEKQAAAERAAAKKAAAEQKEAEKQRAAAERAAAAERRAAEQQAAAEQREAEKQRKAAEKQAAAEQKEAEKQQKAEQRAAEAARREAEKQQAAAEKQAAAEQKAAEKQAAAEQKEAERQQRLAELAQREVERQLKAAERQAAAEHKEAEKQRKAAEKQAAAEERAAKKQAAAERAAKKATGGAGRSGRARKPAPEPIEEFDLLDDFE